MDIAIYGAGKCGEYVLKEIRSNAHKEIRCTHFIDNNPNYFGKEVKGIPIVDVEVFLRENQVDAVLVAVSDMYIAQEMVISLLRGGYDNIYVVPYNMLRGEIPVFNSKGKFASYIYRYDEYKPVLPYIEYHASDFCNLNCKGCGHFANISSTKQFPDIEEFREALQGCSQKFAGIGAFRLMGGEPFTNPDLDLYIRLVREIFPYSSVQVVTNGLLLPYLSEKVSNAIRECGVLVEITQYPVTRDILERLFETAKERQIKISIGNPITKFFKQICTNTNEDYYLAWEKCVSKTCHFLRDGRLYPCPMILGYENRDFLGLDILESTAIRNSFDLINGEESGWEIMLKLEEPSGLCRYCSTDVEWFNWCISSKKTKKEEWIVDRK